MCNTVYTLRFLNTHFSRCSLRMCSDSFLIMYILTTFQMYCIFNKTLVCVTALIAALCAPICRADGMKSFICTNSR